MIRAMIFDMDGTLVDSETVHFEAWKKTLASHGATNFPFKDFISYVGASNEKLADDYIQSGGLEVARDRLVQEKQIIYLNMISGIRLLDGVEETIRKYFGKYRLAVASSSDCVEIEKILNTVSLRSSFEQVVGGDMVSRKKPDPEIYLKTARLLSLTPQQCIAFEDSESGLTAAKDAGMFAVAVPNKLSGHHDFSRADLIVDSIDLVAEVTVETFSAARE